MANNASLAKCPLSSFRFNSSSAEAWVEHEWSNAALDGEDVATVVVGAVLLVGSLLALVKGDSLVKPMFFLSGAVAAGLPAFAATDAILGALPWALSPVADCTLLVAVPVLIAIVGGLLNLWLLWLAFLTLGAVSGGAIGYWLYVLALHAIPSPTLANGYSLVFCLSIALCALVGGVAVLRAKHALLMLCTSCAGAVGAVVGLDLLLLGRLDRRFLALLDARAAAAHLASPFVYGQLIVVAALALAGFAFQRHQREKRRLHAYAQPLITA